MTKKYDYLEDKYDDDDKTDQHWWISLLLRVCAKRKVMKKLASMIKIMMTNVMIIFKTLL